MKTKNLYIILAFALMSLGLASCGGAKEPSALVAQCERLNGEFGTIAEESPMFLDTLSCSYDNSEISVKVGLADSARLDVLDGAFVEFVAAQWMKSHADENLAIILNTLSEEKGKLSICIASPGSDPMSFEISGSRLKQLYKLPNSELGFSDARTVALKIFENECEGFRQAVNAESCDFTLSGGFAQFTLTFKTAQAFANQTQGTMQGRYRNVLIPEYENYGACRQFIIDVFKSLQIEGYRFVYTDEAGSKELKSAIPWRYIE